MGQQGFRKFMKEELSGAKKKEAFRQEKRQVKAERKAAGDEARKRKFEQQTGQTAPKPTWSKNTKAASPKKGPAKPSYGKAKPQQQEPTKFTIVKKADASMMPLNKFIAHAGVCGRREAAELVKLGHVTVNGDKVFEPGCKVSEKDTVTVKGKKIFLQQNLVYILLNKPKDYITTANDPQGRKTVLDLIKGVTAERVYPVGRLDRNTTGVLLLTNDGELAQKLTHPSFEIKKIYEVKLDKPVVKKDMEAIAAGITLEDGFVAADAVGYVDSKDKSVIGIELHSGRNRIVRRIFEHLGYDVRNLDRVMFANLTKKNVERGKWRYLNEKEVRLLKYMNQSFVKKQQS
jgi:23S rRNA pseudouridine2605 synthase